MSLAGYFGRSRRELRMGPADAQGPLGGVRFEGPVLTGEKSVAERRAELCGPGPAEGEAYRHTGEYDAVLRAHCRHEE